MRNQMLCISCLVAVLLSGCILEDSILELFIDDEGRYNVCPSMAGNSSEVTLSPEQYLYIQYYDSQSEEEEPELRFCRRIECLSESNCCGLKGEQAKTYYNSFRYGICPKRMTCKTEQYNSDNFYCSLPEANCTEEQQECGGACVNLNTDMNHCGQCYIKCSTESVKHSKKTACNEGACHALECEPGYHIEGGQCINDSAKICGGKNCYDLEGWLDGDCSPDGECIVRECKPEYHKYEENGHIVCELDSVEHCGSHYNECKKSDGVRYMICNENAQCEATKCEKGYHWNRTNTDCTADSIEECGWFNNNCNALAGWMKGAEGNECRDGYNCYAGACAEGYHVYNSQEEYGINIPCEADTNENCGSHGNDCTKDHLMCSGGVCSNDCTPGYKPCNGGCASFSNDPMNCGECGHQCTTDEIADSTAVTCRDSYCVPTSCSYGYHVNGNSCVPDSPEHCGEENVLCNEAMFPNGEVFGCQAGQCVLEACKTGYHVSGGVCVQDTNNHCGNSGADCSVAFPYGNAVCQSGKCVLQSCVSGYHRTGDSCVGDDVSNCGGTACTIPSHTVVKCESAQCVNRGCENGYGDCDNDMSNGCEIHLRSAGLSSCTSCADDFTHCGTYSGSMPLCLTVGLVTPQFCQDYCSKNGKGGTYNGVSGYYNVKRCNPGQHCYINSYSDKEVKCR